MIDRSRLERILHHGTKAPSGDNTQPWRFAVKGDTVYVYALPELDNPILNIEARGTMIAIGALVENISIAAQEDGLDTAIDLSHGEDDAVARVHFDERDRSGHPLFHTIEKRHTNRNPYHQIIQPSFFEHLRDIHEGDARALLVTDRHAIETIAHSSVLMEEAALRTKKLHRSFFDSIFWDENKNENGEAGMYIKTMELPPPVQLLFRALNFWPVTATLNRIGFARGAALGNSALYARTGACIAVILTGTTQEDFINAGRCMERAWLTATAEGLAAQPLAGLLYLAEYVRRTNDPDIASQLRKRILAAQESIEQAVGSKGVVMILRIGLPHRPASARTKRRAPHITYEQ